MIRKNCEGDGMFVLRFSALKDDILGEEKN